MKLNSIISSNHSLKKNGYKLLCKLHKMEKKKGAQKAYSAALEDTYFFILYIESLMEIIDIEYDNPEKEKCIKKFKEKNKEFLNYICSISQKEQKINKRVLANYLKAYTRFFNKMIKTRYTYKLTDEILIIWNEKCLMAYIATWGKL